MKTLTLTIAFILIHLCIHAQVTTVKKSNLTAPQKVLQSQDTTKKVSLPVKQNLPVNRKIRTVVPISQQNNQSGQESTETPAEEPESTLVTGSFTDVRDGHTYTWVEIGSQVWMSQNLAWLPQLSPITEGSNRDPCCYVYDFESTDTTAAKATENYLKYGVLYNWTAATTACPQGWHLPSDAEWKQLETQLGMPSETVETIHWRGTPVGGMLKSDTGWDDAGNGNGGTNESGFSAMPGGLWSTYNGGSFDNEGIMGFYWTATQIPPQYANDNPMHAYYRSFSYALKDVNYYVNPKSFAKSVRCVRDE